MWLCAATISWQVTDFLESSGHREAAKQQVETLGSHCPAQEVATAHNLLIQLSERKANCKKQIGVFIKMSNYSFKERVKVFYTIANMIPEFQDQNNTSFDIRYRRMTVCSRPHNSRSCLIVQSIQALVRAIFNTTYWNKQTKKNNEWKSLQY